MRDRFEAVLEGRLQLPEFELVSGHDGTILVLFAAIGHFDFGECHTGSATDYS